MVTVGFLAILLYGRALNFAFFNDDPSGHFAWMETRTVTDFFRGSLDYGYYRPVVFTVLQSLVSTAGYAAPLFHALLLLLHGANVAMVWLLAFRIGGARPYGWAAAVIFATVPFSYEAVAYVASLTHPLHVFWLLLTILLYQNARRAAHTRGRSAALIYYIAAFIALVVALFSHENGLLIPILLVGIEWLEYPPHGLREGIKRPFLPYLGAAVLYFLFWLVVPKNNEQSLTSLTAIFSNLLPFLQTLIYPLLPVISLSAESTALLIGLTILMIVLMFVLAYVAGVWRIGLFALLWFGLGSLPAILFLSPAYLYGSPRLHYLPAIGAALFWALPVLALLQISSQKNWQRTIRATAAAFYVLLIILPPLPFINCELDFYEEAGSIVYQLRDMAQTAPVEQELIFVNVPFFFSSTSDQPQGCPNSYPWTPVGSVVIPPYAKISDFIRFNGGPDRRARALTAQAYAPGWNTHGEETSLAQLRDLVRNSAVFVFELTGSEFFNLSAAWQIDQPLTNDPLATFDGRILLIDAGVNESSTGHEIEVDLKWQAATSQESAATVFVHLYDQSGQLVAQHDGPPAQNFVPLAQWQPGDIIKDSHILRLATPLSPGTYKLVTGLYDPATGERLPATQEGQSLADNLYAVETLTIP
ncbi:MAG: hypothetical protein R3293_06400 [Candidatus Promineifilaceae bacterium]|nr:hypothetical protein [Candidatus Promineifilaceae bacterium]